MTAGAKTVQRDTVGGAGSTLGETSFLSGAAVILWMGLLHSVPLARAILAAALGALAIFFMDASDGAGTQALDRPVGAGPRCHL